MTVIDKILCPHGAHILLGVQKTDTKQKTNNRFTNESKSWFFEESKKIDKLLAIMNKKERG